MSLDQATIDALAARLEAAERDKAPITKITGDYPDLDWDDAYAIQDRIRQSKIDAGVKIAGLKAGLTSKAKMKQMNVEEPVFGSLRPPLRSGSRTHAAKVGPEEAHFSVHSGICKFRHLYETLSKLCSPPSA